MMICYDDSSGWEGFLKVTFCICGIKGLKMMICYVELLG